jgi:hypothetical protein
LDAASYVRRLRRLADENGFAPGSPMIDLSGVSAGLLFAMGARPLGAAWTLGGYPGSNDFLAAALNRETCETIATAWILTEPGSKDWLSWEMLRPSGIDIARDYREVASIDARRAFAPLTFEQRLLKPTRNAEVARLACEQARTAHLPNQPG